jgi:hypothetical protein
LTKHGNICIISNSTNKIYREEASLQTGTEKTKEDASVTFKTFCKRANRGLILGAVLLIGLIVYIAVDESNFRAQTPAIRQTITDYCDGLEAASVYPESLQKTGSKLTTQAASQMQKELEALLNQHWITSRYTGTGYRKDKNSTLEDMVFNLQENTKREGYVKKMSLNLGQIKVNKDGPGAASVTFEYSLVAEYTGSPAVFAPGTNILLDESYGSQNVNMNSTTLKRQTIECYEVHADLESIDGEWKITQMVSYGYSPHTPVDVEGGDTE